MDTIDLLDQAYAWTAARIAVVPADGLDRPTPCSRWNLGQLLEHTIESLTLLTDAVAPEGPARSEASWSQAITDLAARSRRAWQAPGVMDRTIELPIGSVPAPAAASITRLEAVVHGWDISQATGEAAEIPDTLARPVLEFARQAIDDGSRGDNFAAALDVGLTPSAQLVAFLGRKPL